MQEEPGDSGAPLWLLHALFVLSGLTALVYEVLWLRGFAVLLGSTLESMTCVLTAFMLGLAAGSALAGRWLRGRALPAGRCVLVYGALELVIGLYGLAFTTSLFLHQDGWLALVAPLLAGSTAARLVAGFAVVVVTLAVPTLCMGATLPVLSGAVRRGVETSGLYGSNLLGAAAGSLLASFALIYWFGCLASAAIVAGTNLLIFGVCVVASRARALRDAAGGAGEDAAALAAGPPWPRPALLGLAFFSGFTFFGFELVWNRCLGLLLGNRIYVTSVTLAVVLTCLAIGARLGRLALLGGRSPARTLGGAYTLAAVSIAAALALSAEGLRGPDPLVRLAFVVLLVGVPATALGVGLPLLIALPVRREDRAAHVGTLYAVNTLGSVVGTLLTGYVLLPALGSGLLIALSGLLLCACAGALWATSPGRDRRGAAALALAAALVASQARTVISPVDPARALVLEEDRHGVFSISPVGTSAELSVRCDATELVYHHGSPVTQFVQESQAHVPLAFAARPRRVVVIGSGYGITAGAFAAHARVGHVDAVEILPLLVAHAERFAPENHRYHAHEKVTVHVSDGRHFLALADAPFDVISINVSDPYLPGSSSLFSREFYRLVARRLAPGGVVAQHVFGPDAASLLAGFEAALPHVRAVPGYGNSVTLIGAPAPLAVVAPDAFDAHPLARRSVAALGRPAQTLADLLREGDAALARLRARPVEFVNSDVHPALEFRRSDELDTFFSNR